MTTRPSTTSFYEILGVSPSASPATIKRAYQQAALATHPDKTRPVLQPIRPIPTGMDSDSLPTYPSFLDVQAAWDTLRHPTTRDAYDQQLQRQQREEQGGGFVADEVKVDEMDEEGGEHGEGGWLVYPCRCGDGFRVRKDEVEGRAGRGIVVPCDGCSLRIRVHR